MIANAGAVIAGITSSLVTTERPTRNISRWCGALPPILAAISGAMVLNTGVGEFADQLTLISMISPRVGKTASIKSGNSRAMVAVRGHHAPSMSPPRSADSDTRTGLAVRRDSRGDVMRSASSAWNSWEGSFGISQTESPQALLTLLATRTRKMSVASDNIKVRGVRGMEMTEGQRLTVARRLFGDWTGVTNPDLLATLWGNLSPDDRDIWLKRADEADGGQQ